MERPQSRSDGGCSAVLFGSYLGRSRGLTIDAGQMRFSITGVNHKSAPVEVRERLAFDERTLPEALRELKRRHGFVEGLILLTCNHVEIGLACDEHGNGELAIDQFLAETRHVDRDWVRPYLYRFDGRDAIR